MEEKEFEILKFMYDNNYDELNRSRDWPIKIMAFASGIDVAIYGLLKFNPDYCLPCWIKIILAAIVIVVAIITIMNIYNQHKNYKDYRKLQVKLQNKMDIQKIELTGNPIFEEKYTDVKLADEKQKVGLGYHFYISYIFALMLIAIVLIIIQ